MPTKTMRYLYLLLTAVFMMVAGEKGYAQCPSWVYAGKDSTICFSTNVVNLNGKIRRSNGNSLTGYWSGGTGRFSPNSTTLTATYIPSQAEVNAGFVNLILIPDLYCYPGLRDTVRITIQKVQETAVTGPLTLCEFSSGNTYSVPSVAGVSYDWKIAGGSVTSGANTNSVTVTWGAAGPGYLLVKLTNALGCAGISSLEPISRFHFNTSDLLKASIGSNATNMDADIKPTGSGFMLDVNCGGTKGLDLEIPGSNFDRGKMCMTFNWQRDEADAKFFVRGGTEFYIAGGVLQVKLTQKSSTGTAQVVGPINTGYSVPNDDVFRFFTFCYDSVSGIARVMVNDSVVWNYTTGTSSSLYWTGSGNAFVGQIMDGNCSGRTLIDWANVSIPVSIYPRPITTVTGMTPACLYDQKAYWCDTPSRVSYVWSATHGSILSGQSSPYTSIKWQQAGAKQVQLLLTDTVSGCDSAFSFAVNVNALPNVSIIGDDSLCFQDSITYTKSSNGHLYTWSRSSHAQVSSASTFKVNWNAAGQHYLYLRAVDTLTTCANTDTVPIWVQNYPDPQITVPAKLCLNESAFVFVSNADSMLYTWSAAGGTILNGQGTTEVNVNYASAGNYSISVQVTDPEFGCSINEQVGVTVYGKPITGAIFHY